MINYIIIVLILFFAIIGYLGSIYFIFRTIKIRCYMKKINPTSQLTIDDWAKFAKFCDDYNAKR